MKEYAKWGLSLSITIYGLLHFISYFFEASFLLAILSISGIGIVGISIIILSVKKLKMPLGLFIVGLSVLFISDASILKAFPDAFL